MPRDRRDDDMDAKPKSNKQKRLEKRRKLKSKAERLGRQDPNAAASPGSSWRSEQ